MDGRAVAREVVTGTVNIAEDKIVGVGRPTILQYLPNSASGVQIMEASAHGTSVWQPVHAAKTRGVCIYFPRAYVAYLLSSFTLCL